MPNLPSRYESQVAAQANRRIIEQPTFAPDTSMGDALQKVGQVGLEVAGRIQKAETDQQLIKAEIDARTRLDRLRYDLEADAETPDAAIPVRWRQESEAILKEVGGTIGSERARELWMTRAKGWQGEGENWSVGLSRKRSVEKVRGQHITNVTELSASAGDMAISAETYAARQAAVLAGVKSSAELGLIGADDVARYEADIAAAGVKDRTMRFTSNLEALMKDGRVAEADALYQAQMGMNREGKSTVDPDTLAKVKSGLEQSKQEFATVEKADRFWAAAKGDYGKYMELVSGVQDVSQRLDLEKRGTQLAQQANAAREAEQDTFERAMWQHVQGGGTIMNASPALRAKIDPDRLGSIRAFENARDAEKGMTAAELAQKKLESGVNRTILSSSAYMPASTFMRDVSTWPPEAQARFSLLTADDQVKVFEDQIKMREEGASYPAINRVEAMMVDMAKAVADPAWGMNLPVGQRTPKANKLYAAIAVTAANFSKEDLGGKPPTREQVERAVAAAIMMAANGLDDGDPQKPKARTSPSGDSFNSYGNNFVDWQAYTNRMDPNLAMNQMESDQYAKAFADLRAARNGVDPTFEEVQSLLKRRGQR